ncbi:unnamed protein product, partial [Cuscuta epithymum]
MLFTTMDATLLVMLKVDGIWDSDYMFNNVHTCGLRVNYTVQYASFIDSLSGILSQYKPNYNFRISYMRDGCPPPITINDQSSLTFYLYIKSLQPDFQKYPLCVEFYPISSSPPFSIDVEPSENLVIDSQQHTPYESVVVSSSHVSQNVVSSSNVSQQHITYANVVSSAQQLASSP